MPDVANALKFQKKLTAIETAYLKQIDQYRRETRRVLLEIVDREGVTRPAVNQMINAVTDMGRSISGVAAIASKDARNTVANYTRKQLQVAKRVGLTDNIDLAPVLSRGSQAAQDGEQSYMTNTSAWLSQLETSLQTQAAKLRISNAAPDEIVNRLLSEPLADGRASVWRASGNAAQSEETLNLWNYGVGLLGVYIAAVNDSQPDVQYQKQVVATIDERTTDCCLEAHGQIQPIDEPFQLTGEPRFADEVQDPPFHYFCRSSEVLYHEEFEKVGITTAEMEDAAQAELTARKETGTRVPIYPSHATARRG